jgi:hypothetical protein
LGAGICVLEKLAIDPSSTVMKKIEKNKKILKVVLTTVIDLE